MEQQEKAGGQGILVVDDNEANRMLARQALEDEGFRVVAAASGLEALKKFEESAIECVLLDVRMPGMDGFAVCEELRARSAEIPVIFFTAQRDIDTFERALRVGADDFLTKPVHPAELVVRVQAGLKLRRLRAEVREYYDMIRHQRDDLMRLSLQKERLTAFLVHDLKNPVNNMDLQAQLLMRGNDVSEAVRTRASKIRDEARQLNRMLLNLLDLSKGEEGKLVPRRATVDLGRLIATVMEELEPAALGREVVLEGDGHKEQIEADQDLLYRTLINLVDNAIRHAPQGSVIRIEAQPRAETIELRVRDQGPGVPSEMRTRLFDPFVQLESGDQVVTRSNRGLGLAFCKLAAEAHGGRIWIEDASPGAVFCIQLPRVGVAAGDPT